MYGKKRGKTETLERQQTAIPEEKWLIMPKHHGTTWVVQSEAAAAQQCHGEVEMHTGGVASVGNAAEWTMTYTRLMYSGFQNGGRPTPEVYFPWHLPER